MQNEPTSSAALRAAPSKAAIVLEIAAIFVLIFVYAGGPPPDVNEAHYLTKAKHYWNPSWYGEDVFLDSAYPHLTFYWLFGWVTLFASLTTTAWVGRLLSWGLFAIAWQRLSWSVVPRRFASLGTAALFLLLVERFHLAGEWVVGGIEAKAIAYPLVLFGVRSMVLGQWRAVWLWLGGASAFHVLVGGWSVVAAAGCWLLRGRNRIHVASMLPALIGGGCLALFGLLPAFMMSGGATPAVLEKANQIYVFGRLPHHLVFHEFAPRRMVLFALLLLAWGGISGYPRGRTRRRAINQFAVASLVISCVGVGIDLVTPIDRELAARLLKLYWFRLADMAVPLAVALGGALAVGKLARSRPGLAQTIGSFVMVMAAVSIGWQFYQRQLDFRPRAEVQSRPAHRHGTGRAYQHYEAWRRACRWIQQRTPASSRFLTPRNQQTFKWYAGRAELACWKDIPQDPEHVVRWWRLLHQVYPPKVIKHGLAAWSDAELREIVEQHKIDYIVVDRRRAARPLSFHRVYPSPGASNAYFEVYSADSRGMGASGEPQTVE